MAFLSGHDTITIELLVDQQVAQATDTGTVPWLPNTSVWHCPGLHPTLYPNGCVPFKVSRSSCVLPESDVAFYEACKWYALAHRKDVSLGAPAMLLVAEMPKDAALNLLLSGKATFDAVDQIRAEFQTSRTATALRMVDYGPEPALLVCHGPDGRRWFKRGPAVPDRWFPRDEIDADSDALEVLHGTRERTTRSLIGADAWFDRWEAERYEVYEQTVRMSTGDALTLVVIKSAERLCCKHGARPRGVTQLGD